MRTTDALICANQDAMLSAGFTLLDRTEISADPLEFGDPRWSRYWCVWFVRLIGHRTVGATAPKNTKAAKRPKANSALSCIGLTGPHGKNMRSHGTHSSTTWSEARTREL